MENTNLQRPWYFNLNADGDSAVVRILHSSTNTIESLPTHRVEVDGKKKRVKCLKDNCPLCTVGEPDSRIYIHLYDYAQNKDVVWERTDKIMNQLMELEASWSPLDSAVIRITRKGNEFPKYTIDVLNPMQYQPVDKSLIDMQLAKYYSMGRSAEEMQTYINTGAFPERKPYLPREEYLKQKENEKTSEQPEPATPAAEPAYTMSEQTPASDVIFDDDPFSNAFAKLRKV